MAANGARQGPRAMLGLGGGNRAAGSEHLRLSLSLSCLCCIPLMDPHHAWIGEISVDGRSPMVAPIHLIKELFPTKTPTLELVLDSEHRANRRSLTIGP